tara:strand:+ start:2447 stop:2671 length:225 start_codon:yes stop_codon:yes gene_type:complete
VDFKAIVKELFTFLLRPVAIAVFKALVTKASEILREKLKAFVLDYYNDAITTPKKSDDVLAIALCKVAKVKLPS